MFSIKSSSKSRFRLAEDDACFFRHPNIEYLRVSWVNIRSLEKLQSSYFQLNNLHSLYLDAVKCNKKSLKRLVQHSTSMTCIKISHAFGREYERGPRKPSVMDYVPTLTQAASTLQVLKLTWNGFPHHIGGVIDLSMYTALRMLALPLRLILGDDNKTMDDAARSITDRLPPDVRRLLLEDVVSPYWGHRSRKKMVPRGPVELIRLLIEEKEEQALSLNCILITSSFDTVIDFPKSLYSIAKLHRVQIGIIDGIMDYKPPQGWLDEL